ncbi:MAG TPA: hypothetical protein VD770_03775 [Coxiellaceae bacterium]|nr:hypothetical protein [Coxiellaceae bacterium]
MRYPIKMATSEKASTMYELSQKCIDQVSREEVIETGGLEIFINFLKETSPTKSPEEFKYACFGLSNLLLKKEDFCKRVHDAGLIDKLITIAIDKSIAANIRHNIIVLLGSLAKEIHCCLKLCALGEKTIPLLVLFMRSSEKNVAKRSAFALASLSSLSESHEHIAKAIADGTLPKTMVNKNLNEKINSAIQKYINVVFTNFEARHLKIDEETYETADFHLRASP